jgi:trimethylamine corrinoid protein
MVNQKTFEDMMQEAGLKGKCLTNVGGAPVTQQWADEIGADIYSENANDAAAKFSAKFKN